MVGYVWNKNDKTYYQLLIMVGSGEAKEMNMLTPWTYFEVAGTEGTIPKHAPQV